MTKRILVVDDSRFIADAMRLALRKAGYEVTIAQDLWELEGLAAQPDLVVVDLVLQEAFGDDIAMLLRAMHGYTCPIVLMSSIPDAELQQRASEAGLDGCIPKRLGLAGIAARVRELVGDAGASMSVPEPSKTFPVNARQRLRRVLHISATPDHWNSAAIMQEMHALAGDADLCGAAAVADAARTCRDLVKRTNAERMTPELQSAFDTLGKAIDCGRTTGSKVFVLDDGTRDPLIAELDAAGHVVVEASSLTEARQKMRATKYDVVVLAESLHRKEPSLMTEVRAHLPDAPLEIVPGSVEPKRVVQQLETILRARGT